MAVTTRLLRARLAGLQREVRGMPAGAVGQVPARHNPSSVERRPLLRRSRPLLRRTCLTRASSRPALCGECSTTIFSAPMPMTISAPTPKASAPKLPWLFARAGQRRAPRVCHQVVYFLVRFCCLACTLDCRSDAGTPYCTADARATADARSAACHWATAPVVWGGGRDGPPTNYAWPAKHSGAPHANPPEPPDEPAASCGP